MKNDQKVGEAYKTIGEVSEDLGLIDKKTGVKQTHTLRYWESQFKQIRPIIRAGNRRYYSEKDLKIIKMIKFLLKEKGLTIKGVKKILSNSNIQSLDENVNLGVYKRNSETTKMIKNKLKNITKIIKELKNYK
tara:strand:- start:511 stop:909 length:399 start_codon:yes stop_codon:yes gene_type:complete